MPQIFDAVKLSLSRIPVILRNFIQTLKAGVFQPNILFLTLGDNPEKDNTLHQLVTLSSEHELGIIILRQHPRMAFGLQKKHQPLVTR